MRSDYPLYVIALICFIITVVAYYVQLSGVTELYLYGLVVLGIVFIGLGYMARPKNTAFQKSTVQPVTPAAQITPTKQEPEVEDKPKTAPKKSARKKRTKASSKKPATRRTRKRTTRSKKKT
jgi:hypothetical protein